MSKYENAMKLMDDRCGNNKDNLIALATLDTCGTRPAVRMLDAYYEDGAFYISTNAVSAKMKQIEANNTVAIGGTEWFTAQGTAENLGWVKDEKNADIRAKMKKIFVWFDDHAGEDSPNSIVLRVNLTEGTIIDHAQTYGEGRYDVDFVNKTAK